MCGFKILTTEAGVVQCMSRLWEFCTDYLPDILIPDILRESQWREGEKNGTYISQSRARALQKL